MSGSNMGFIQTVKSWPLGVKLAVGWLLAVWVLMLVLVPMPALILTILLGCFAAAGRLFDYVITKR